MGLIQRPRQGNQMHGIKDGAEECGLHLLIWLSCQLRPPTLLKVRWGISGWDTYSSAQLTANSVQLVCAHLAWRYAFGTVHYLASLVIPNDFSGRSRQLYTVSGELTASAGLSSSSVPCMFCNRK
jgi:hypothetical protein